MIGQYLSKKNKITKVAKSEFFSELNKACMKQQASLVSFYIKKE